MQNEVGILGDSRDRLYPDLLKLWETAGFKTAGTWQEVFGPGGPTIQRGKLYHYK